MKSIQYTLWLEFEHTLPLDDKFNDFANISVTLEDGRAYGINVWTYEFLKTAFDLDIKDGKSGAFQIPPDLFVKELSRECIQNTIEELLNQGNLEDLLNPSIFGLSFIEPWRDVNDIKDLGEQLKQELSKEIGSTHPLFEKSIEIIAKRQDNDDILIRVEDGKLATVHLTWSGKTEQGHYPLTRFYYNEIDFWNSKMKYDIIEFNV